MLFNTYFGSTISDASAEITPIFAGAYIVIIVVGAVFLVWQVYKARQAARNEELEARKHIKFEPKKSLLVRGSLRLTIPENSLEYFICKAVFDEPTSYQLDLNILEEAGLDSLEQRPVYQAVRRINDKAKRNLELNDELLERGKEKTILNEKYI